MWRPDWRRAVASSGLIRRAVALGVILLAGAAAAEPKDGAVPTVASAAISAPQLELAAVQAYEAGQFDLALGYAERLLLSDPKNALGHFIVGQIMLRAGNTETARIAARESFRNAGSERQRYEAARLAGQVALRDERWFAAQYWARETVQYAPDPKRREIGISDYRRLRARAPLSWSLALGLRPSDNVNGGADERINVIDGWDAVGVLSDDALALRGVAATANLEAQWRVAQNRESETRLGITGYARVVELAGTPMRQPVYLPGSQPPPLEEIHNSEFSSAAFGVTASHTRMIAPGRVLGVTGEIGRNWQAGSPAYDYQRVQLTGAAQLDHGRQLSFATDYEHRDWVETLRHDDRRSVNLNYAQPLGHGVLGFGASAYVLDSSSSQARSWSVTGSVNYTPAWQIGPLQLSFATGLSKTVYPDYTILWMHPPGGRQDDSVFAEVGVSAPKFGIAAFAPELKLQALNVDSNVSRFTRSEVAVALGWRSAF